MSSETNLLLLIYYGTRWGGGMGGISPGQHFVGGSTLDSAFKKNYTAVCTAC